MFDVYLHKGCETLPELIDLSEIIPNLVVNEVCEKLLVENPGFLGINLSLLAAKKLIGILKEKKINARGRVIPVQYRDSQPKLDKETAFQIADKYLKEIQSTTYSSLHFNETSYAPAHNSLMYFTFAASANEWEEAGLIPGAIFASVDKLDGHIWSDEEKRELIIE